MDAVLDGLRRDPPFSVWLFAQYSRVPAAMWLAVILLEFFAFITTRGA